MTTVREGVSSLNEIYQEGENRKGHHEGKSLSNLVGGAPSLNELCQDGEKDLPSIVEEAPTLNEFYQEGKKRFN